MLYLFLHLKFCIYFVGVSFDAQYTFNTYVQTKGIILGGIQNTIEFLE